MREFLDSVQFHAETQHDLPEIVSFHSEYGNKMPYEGAGTLTGELYGQSFECEIRLIQTEAGPLVSTDLSSVRGEASERLYVLRDEMSLWDWIKALESFPPGFLKLSFDVEYHKANDVPAWRYIAFSPEGLRSIGATLLSRFVAGETPEIITVETSLVEKSSSHPGLLLIRLADPNPPEKIEGPLLVPQEPEGHLASFLARLQTEYIFSVTLGHRPPHEISVSSGPIVNLAEWLQAHDLRKVIAVQHLKDSPLLLNDTKVQSILAELQQLESDLVRGTLQKFETAKATFREISIDLLRDLHKMRGEVSGLMGAELFRISTSIAITLAGLSLANIRLINVSLGISVLVGGIFFVGAAVKATTQKREFQNLVTFNQHFSTMPVAQAMPEFRGWYVKTVNDSVNGFFLSFVLGLLIALVPVYGVATYWLRSSKPEWYPGTPAMVLIFLIACLTFSAAMWKWGPWKELKISFEPK